MMRSPGALLGRSSAESCLFTGNCMPNSTWNQPWSCISIIRLLAKAAGKRPDAHLWERVNRMRHWSSYQRRSAAHLMRNTMCGKEQVII